MLATNLFGMRNQTQPGDILLETLSDIAKRLRYDFCAFVDVLAHPCILRRRAAGD